MKLVQGLAQRVDGKARDLDMLDWMGRAALEIIGQAGLGHSFDPLTSDCSDVYTTAAKTYLYVEQSAPARCTVFMSLQATFLHATHGRRTASKPHID